MSRTTSSPSLRSDSSRSRSDGPLRLTKIGFWTLAVLVVVVVAAANTGNNGLYLTVAFFLGALGVAWAASKRNLGGLEARMLEPPEIFAGRSARIGFEVSAAGRLRRWLVLGLDSRDVEPAPESFRPAWIASLQPDETAESELEISFARRGLHRLSRLRMRSLFPLGLYHQGRRCAVDADVLVYPEILEDLSEDRTRGGRSGDDAAPQAGWGHDLYSLRDYRVGDDPRHIHWKQSARTGDLIYQERQKEESRQLLIVFDNLTGRLDEFVHLRFERLVSEAATVLLRELEMGYEVGMVVRGEFHDFAEGTRQRRRLLETLALIEPLEFSDLPLPMPSQRVAAVNFSLGGDESAGSESVGSLGRGRKAA